MSRSTLARTMGRLSLLSSACLPISLNAQSDSLSHTVFVHGAGGYNQSQWGYALNSLSGSYSFPFGYAQTDIYFTVWATDWYAYIAADMIPDSSILVGYSLGGVAVREAADSIDALGLVSIGSPQTGAPVAASIESAVELVDDLEYSLSYALSIAFSEFLEAFTSIGEALYWDLVALIDSWFYGAVQNLVEAGYGYLDTFMPDFETDLPPGSTWMNQLPTGIANSYTLSVRMSPGHLGGPLALLSEVSQEDADDAGEDIMYWGWVIANEAEAAQAYIDWGHEHAYAVYDALLASAVLGLQMTDYPYYWCGAVESGNVYGACAPFASDGLIPSARQTFSSANDTALHPGPPHTKELTNSSVIEFVGDRLCALSPSC
ncbi:MAG TPA: alpha/beta hydrolase [Gemmatimonadaceae bacterium]